MVQDLRINWCRIKEGIGQESGKHAPLKKSKNGHPSPGWPFFQGTGTAGLLACRNGVVNIEDRTLLPHDPGLFQVNCLPFDYDDAAPTYPPMWQRFLRQLWPGDEDGKRARLTLGEMFGLMLTPDTRYQRSS